MVGQHISQLRWSYGTILVVVLSTAFNHTECWSSNFRVSN